MPVDFGAAIKNAEKEGLVSGGDTFKFKEGQNRIRLLSECLPHRGAYQGKPNFKWLCYVIDRADGMVKVFFMPHTIYKQIAVLQKSDDYGFDDVPMPYDITVNAKGAGTKEVEYTLTAARKNTEVTPAEMDAYGKKKPLDELQGILYAKAEERGDVVTHEEAPHYDPDEMPV